MVILEKVPDLKYLTQPFRLPYLEDDKRNGSEAILLIRNTNQATSILDNPLVKRDMTYTKYYKMQLYVAKFFTKQQKLRFTPSDQKDMTSFLRSIRMTLAIKMNQVGKKNFVFDTSAFNTAFFEDCEGRNKNIIAEKYAKELQLYLIKDKFEHKNKYIFLNIADWGIDASNKSTIASSMSKQLNPIHIIYHLLKKNLEALEPLKEYKLIVLDGDHGWFKLDLSTVDNTTYQAFNRLCQKFRTTELKLDAEEEDAPTNELPEEDDDEEVVKLASEPEDDNIVHKQLEKDVDDTAEILKMAEEELEDNYASVSRTMPRNKRIEELRKKQKDVKLKNMTAAEAEKLKVKNYHIDETDISDKIFCPTKNVKTIRFDNFNESYAKTTMERDITDIFKGMADKNLPVMIVGDIVKEDTSTPMDLKYTYKVTLESEDGLRHNITVDVPKIYDKNYMFLGGNRKQITNQLFPVPLIKIAPDTVQICTNFNKIFMYRYGDIVSPKVTVFKKIIANNPKYFKTRKGNALSLTNGRKTSIEYDSIARDYISIEIRGTGVQLNFDQKMYQNLLDEKKISPIGDDYIFCLYDPKASKDLLAIPVSVDAEFSEEDDFDVEDESKKSYKDMKGSFGSPIDLFAFYYKKTTGENFWDLAGPKEKAGKRFMYTRCAVMEKKIPTIIFLSYFEGLANVLTKANIEYRFSDKRERITVDEGVIQFADGYLIFKRNPTRAGLLMNGLTLVDTKAYNFEDFNDKGVYLDIFESLYGSRILASGLDSYYDNMIDPITREILEDMDLPTDFVSLIIAANNLLADNNSSSEIDMSNYRVRNLEIISAYLYKLVASAYSKYKRHSMNKNPTKISVARGDLIKALTTSNIVEDYSIINPITEKEKLHNATWKGPSGVNLDRAYTLKRRCFDKSMTGIMGVSTSPDAGVGVQRELTVEPKIINSRGYLDNEKSTNDLKDCNLFTYAEQLTPLGVTRDDAIRTSMATKQSG